jgi:prepilin-type processing-associated H-X9-DG protein
MRQRDCHGRRGEGFTLVVLMVVVGIIVLLVAILIPVLGHTRKNANNVKCLANVRSLGQAYLAYVAANRHPPAYYDPVDPFPPTTPDKRYVQTWIAALLESTTSTTNVCPEAKESPGGTVTSFGSVSAAYGDSTAPYSFGGYGFNGYLYWANEPGQVANPTGAGAAWSQGGRAGYKFANPPAGAKFEDLWFSDPLSADGGTVPQSVITALAPTPVPTTFGSAGSIPIFADANQYHAWPQHTDATPSGGSYTVTSGDQSATTYKLGRFCLARHPGGVNVVFLDGHATTLSLEQLWQLRWNKAFVPQKVSIP